MACRMHGLYFGGHLIARLRAREPPCPEVQHRGHGVFHVSHHAFSLAALHGCATINIFSGCSLNVDLGRYTNHPLRLSRS